MECNRSEAEHREKAMEIGHDGGLESAAERPCLDDDPRKYGRREEQVGEQPACARHDPERRIARGHESPPQSSVRPFRVTRTTGTSCSSASAAASSEPPLRKSEVARTSASAAVRAAAVTVSKSLSAGAPVAGSMTWCASSWPSRCQRRRSRPDVARAPSRSSSVIVPAGVSTPTGQAHPAPTTSPPASTRAGPAEESIASTRSAAQPLAMPPRSRWTPLSSVTKSPSMSTLPPHSDATRGAGVACPRRNLLEAAVVAGGHDCAVDSGVEAPPGRVTGS